MESESNVFRIHFLFERMINSAEILEGILFFDNFLLCKAVFSSLMYSAYSFRSVIIMLCA